MTNRHQLAHGSRQGFDTEHTPVHHLATTKQRQRTNSVEADRPVIANNATNAYPTTGAKYAARATTSNRTATYTCSPPSTTELLLLQPSTPVYKCNAHAQRSRRINKMANTESAQ